MADRYNTLSFVRTIGAGVTDSFAKTISVNSCNIVKIKCVPSIPAAPTEFAIFKNLTYALADVAYRTKQFTGNLIDPVEDNGVLVLEVTEAFVCAYEDSLDTSSMYFSITNNHSVPVTYTVTVIYDPHITGSGFSPAVPDGLIVKGFSFGTKIETGVAATINSASVDSAEFRALFIPSGSSLLPFYDLRTPAEGGTFVDNGTTQLVVTGLYASQQGALYIWDSAQGAGTWIYAWRLHNTAGWSLWTDGNAVPSRVSNYLNSDDGSSVDSGPPSDWQVTLELGPAPDTVICRATRPAVNGNVINFFAVQILDADLGIWETLLDGSDAGHLRWDGRTISYSLGTNRNSIIDPGSFGWGTAAAGDLVVVDVRGGLWDEQNCQWAMINSIDGNTLNLSNFLNPQVTSDLRLIIIKAPWIWSTNGFLGAEPGHGFYPGAEDNGAEFVGDKQTTEFVSSAIRIPTGVTNPEARVWFQNNFSQADNNLTHSTGLVGLPTSQLWTKVNDRDFFYPAYGKPQYATMVYNSSGKIVITAVNPQPVLIDNGSIWGIKTRFSLYPDLNGLLTIRAKFTNVTIPQGTNANHKLSLFMGLINRTSAATTQFTGTIIRWGNNGTAATIRFDQPSIVDVDGSIRLGNNTYFADVVRPAPGYTLELKLGFGEKSTNSYASQGILSQYSLNGGAWTAASGLENAVTCHLPIIGGEFLIGVVQPGPTGASAAFGNWTATLDEFEVIEGIVVPHRT